MTARLMPFTVQNPPTTRGARAIVLSLLLLSSALTAGCNDDTREKSKATNDLPAGDTPPGPAVALEPPTTPAAPDGKHELMDPGPHFLPGTIAWDAAPIDLSFLSEDHRPAGAQGRVRIKGDNLVFADGTPARFWGTNLRGPALFEATHEAIDQQVKRLSAFGFNLVRIHRHDAVKDSSSVFERDGTTQKLDESALQRLDYWICKLKAAGIYIWLDLNARRTFADGDRVPGIEELRRNESHAKGFSHVNPRVEALMQDFAARYLGRVNHCTGVTYMDEPAVLAMLLSDENDLVTHYGPLLADDQNLFHQDLYRKLADAFADEHGLDREATYQPWDNGPGRLAMIDLEYSLWSRGQTHLRKLGVRSPIVGTSYWGEGLFAQLVSLSTGDMIDTHSFGKEGFVFRHPAKDIHFLHWIGGAQITGKPLTTSEWGVPWPARDRALAPMWVAAIASLQGWDAPMWYAYQGTALISPNAPAVETGAHDPAAMALMPNAALAYRRGDIQLAKRHFAIHLGPEKLLEGMKPSDSRALTTLLERSRVSIALGKIPELGWQVATKVPEDATPVKDPTEAFIASDAKEMRSDTGEIVRDLESGVIRIDTPRTQAVMGWIGKSDPLRLSTLEVEVKTPMAAIAVSSLDNEPLRESRRMLLSVAAQASAGDPDISAFVAEPVEGDVRLHSLVHGLELVPLTPEGRPLAARPGKRRGLRVQFTLPTKVPTHWYLIRTRPGVEGARKKR